LNAATAGNVGVVVASVPITVFGVGDAVPWLPHPASATAPSSAAAMTAGRRTAQDSNEGVRPRARGTGTTVFPTTIRDMQRRSFGRDRGLSLRMLFTSGLLGLLYVGFAVVLFSVLKVGLAPMLLIVIGIAFFQYYTSDKLALAASGAKIVSAEEAPELHAMVERLCAMADLPKPRIAVVDSDVPNAFATGRNPKHAAVAVTQGLWRRLEPQEIESVLAHELSHVANRDVLVMTVASFFAMLAAMLTRFGLYAGMFGGFGGGNRNNNNNQVPVWLIVFLVSVVVYAISFILIRTISRYREYAADRGSAIITGAPENLMSALQKISSGITQIPQRDLREVQGMNAFFIIPTNWKTNMSEWMMDHPPLEKRLAALSQIAREMGKPVS
jgi:heat shock protein HtpX